MLVHWYTELQCAHATDVSENKSADDATNVYVFMSIQWKQMEPMTVKVFGVNHPSWSGSSKSSNRMKSPKTHAAGLDLTQSQFLSFCLSIQLSQEMKHTVPPRRKAVL